MAVLLKEMYKSYYYFVIEKSDQRTIDWPLMRTPFPVIGIIAVYLWFVFKAGPNYMKNRQAFNVDKIIQVYNLLQVVACGYLAVQAFVIYKPWGPQNIVCEEISFEVNDFNQYLLTRAYLYFALKLFDLLDTVFFVLRKKPHQVTFLHVYHHAMMVSVTWYGMRFLPGGTSLFIGIVNSFVHCIMYFYYFLSNYDKTKGRYFWCKKYLTQLQMFQFGSFFVIALLALLTPECKIPKLVIGLLIPQNLFIFLLFLDFYIKTYHGPKSKQTAPKVEKVQ